MYIKINNIRQSDGNYDYKGLDLSKIKAGTQLYPDDENVAFFLYDGHVVGGGDVIIATQEMYNACLEKIENTQAQKPVTDVERIRELEKSQQEQDDLLMEIMMGGLV